ncbi:hypothetical protein BRD15_10235 [Halobacteriales archaeon SW_6_65_15]|nr:MAG: hypothetical protein BRD15_10235 [Halobacteriales archaeon SW_6_65_15]
MSVTPEGDVDRDVVEVTITQKDGEPDAATVKLDTSERPHALEEEADLNITLDDGNNAVTFSGRVDSVKDDKQDPIVTIDAREPDGALDDVSAVGKINEPTLFDVINGIVDGSPGRVRGVTFDPGPLKSRYGTFANSTIFGDVSIAHWAQFGVNADYFGQQETTGRQGKPAELVIDSYRNNTQTRYSMTLTGEDSDGNTVEAQVDLPPGDDVQDAYGTDTFKLPLTGGNQLFQSVSSVSSTVPNLLGDAVVYLSGTVKNYVKTKYDFKVESDVSVRDALNLVVSYISTLDSSNDWEFYVDAQTRELVVQPKSTTSPTRYIFTEGDNVLKPVANRSLDGVYNMVKINGQGQVNAWFWAYDGTFYFSYDNPFESGEYPNAVGEGFGSTGRINDIDQIDLRAAALNASNVDDVFQADDLGRKALKQLYRTPVSGVSRVTGIHPADPGDEAEIYYPSRGIPQKVVDNVYSVKSVEYQVATDEAYTKMDWGITEPKTGDMIRATSSVSGGGGGGAGGGFTQFLRNDLSESVTKQVDNNETTKNFITEQGGPVVGTIQSANDDGTFVVQGENGETYDNVRVI